MPSPQIDQTRDREAIFLLGDSLIQRSWANDGLASRLADDYGCAFDVINRGLNGYKTTWAIPEFKKYLQEPGLPIALLIICFGANDGAQEGAKQHVPVADYKENLRTLIEMTQKNARFKDADIIVMTPPVPDESKIERLLQARIDGKNTTSKSNVMLEDHRRIEDIKDYADAARTLVADFKSTRNIVCADVWKAMKDKTLSDYQLDGLHFSAKGYELAYREVTKAIRELKGAKIPPLDPNIRADGRTRPNLMGWATSPLKWKYLPA